VVRGGEKVDELLQEGIAAAKSGQRERAYNLLMQVVEEDRDNVLAWLWLSGVTDRLNEREICLENVLALDPTNAAARKGLAQVREQQKKAAVSGSGEIAPSSSSRQESAPAETTTDRTPVSPAAAILRNDFARRQPPPEPDPDPPPLPNRDVFEDEFLCPYCAAQTAPDDRRCPACANQLWIKVRRRKERSSWLWVALTLQAASIIWPVFLSLLVLFYAARQAGLDNFFLLAAPYLGLPTDLPADVVDAAFEAIPRGYALPLVLYILFSLVVMVGLYLRWKPVFFLFLVNALLVLGLAIVGMAIGLGLSSEGTVVSPRVGIMCSGGGMILGLLMFLLVLQLEDDFFLDEKRLLLRPDPDATNGPALLGSGYRYAKREMWALAAIHLRRATSYMPGQADPYLALAAAYLNLGRYDLAADATQEAKRIDPENPQIKRLTTILDSRRAAESPSAAPNTA
jgi:tetratricopeptide (TPR) repeat protein